ncbi:hypothetical protein OUZ56_016784 [Daphnia magna]|uniref:Uncharacterized protein n=1 Tax=Daphnia magna TaxID=35525 RepID=A0ABR0ARJ9_9CRUS|nr:hypothetical protein OUZ56_016784 [Daphnia magna]
MVKKGVLLTMLKVATTRVSSKLSCVLMESDLFAIRLTESYQIVLSRKIKGQHHGQKRVFVDPLVATHSILISLEWTHSYLEPPAPPAEAAQSGKPEDAANGSTIVLPELIRGPQSRLHHAKLIGRASPTYIGWAVLKTIAKFHKALHNFAWTIMCKWCIK